MSNLFEHQNDLNVQEIKEALDTVSSHDFDVPDDIDDFIKMDAEKNLLTYILYTSTYWSSGPYDAQVHSKVLVPIVFSPRMKPTVKTPKSKYNLGSSKEKKWPDGDNFPKSLPKRTISPSLREEMEPELKNLQSKLDVWYTEHVLAIGKSHPAWGASWGNNLG